MLIRSGQIQSVCVLPTDLATVSTTAYPSPHLRPWGVGTSSSPSGRANRSFLMPRVVHFEIHAQEPERAARFYSEVFGWEITKWGGPVDYWLIKTGAAP